VKFRELCWDKEGEHTERLWLGTWNDDTISTVSGWDGGLGSDGQRRREAGIQEAHKRIDGSINAVILDGQDGGDHKEA
jgi:hypothetical protein